MTRVDLLIIAIKMSTNQTPKPETTKQKRGWDEIETLFDDKKRKKVEEVATESSARQTHARKNANQRDRSEKPARSAAKNSTPKSNKYGTDGDWVNDGLGGRYNAEGYTGRIEDGVKIFKTHILSKPNAGQTPQCPFDCDCCYI